MAYEKIDYDVVDGRAEMLFNRPDLMNAFDEETLLELNDALQRAMTDDAVYVVILSGRGRGFCSGADVTSMDGREDREKKHLYGSHLWLVQNVDRLLYFGQKPTVAAVNGPAVGAGCDFALACDLRVMGPDGLLREGFVNVGLVPGDGGAWLLPRLVGESKAREYLLTGRDITPVDAVDIGLAVEEADDPLAAARALAAEIRDKPAMAVQHTNRLVDPEQGFEDYCEKATRYQWDCVTDPEHHEAVAAFNEKRAPEYDR